MLTLKIRVFASKTDCLLIDLTSAAVRERSVVVPEATAMAIVASEVVGRRRRKRRRAEERSRVERIFTAV